MSEIVSKEHKLSISLIWKRNKFDFARKGLMENSDYTFGLKIKNIGDIFSPEGKISNFSIKSWEGGNLLINIDDELFFPKLNPKETVNIWFPDITYVFLKWQVWVSCAIEPIWVEPSTAHFMTHQEHRISWKCSTFRRNDWGDAIVIRWELEQQQSVQNWIMLALTLLTLVQGGYWIKAAITDFFDLLWNVFHWIVTI